MDNKLESQWLFMFLELLVFKTKYKHTNVPAKYEANRSLGHWVRRQRYTYSTKTIDGMREELLRLAGFNFRILPVHDWNKMFERLRAFKEKHGHVHITLTSRDTTLHDWLTYQRKLFWKNKLEAKKVSKLQTIGVDMQNRTAGRWDKMFKQLVSFKKQHGHLYVCRFYNADRKLITFAKVIRRRQKKISKERRLRLDKIGFIWNPGKEVTRRLNEIRANEAWKIRYEELKAYKRKFGTSRIKVMDKKYSTLGRWVSVQRCHKQKLSEDKFGLLEKIGFWEDNKNLKPPW